MVHRDIKPSNLMLNKTGNVKITDFGIAHVKTDYSYEQGVVGSPCYMSPEQVQEKPIDDKSDIFSLGCVLYELLTGEKAFFGDNLFSIMRKISHEDPVPIVKQRPGAPEILDKITGKALAKDPDQAEGERSPTRRPERTRIRFGWRAPPGRSLSDLYGLCV